FRRDHSAQARLTAFRRQRRSSAARRQSDGGCLTLLSRREGKLLYLCIMPAEAVRFNGKPVLFSVTSRYASSNELVLPCSFRAFPKSASDPAWSSVISSANSLRPCLRASMRAWSKSSRDLLR